MTARDPFTHYREAMAAVGFTPSSVLGQNFLLDPSLHRWLCAQAAPTAADLVLEIGVGLGFLTRELAAVAGTVVGVEIDRRLFCIVAPELATMANVRLLHADALGGPGRSLHADVVAAIAAVPAAGELIVVANLPYSVSGPLLAELCALPRLPARAVLLVQKEMAQRVAAAPRTADWGGLSAQVQATFTARSIRDVPPQVFRPRPKVVSAVLRLERRQDSDPALATAAARREFGVFVRALFQQRRKVLRTTLPAAAAAIERPVPAGLTVDLGRRAEQLAVADLVAIWRSLGRS
ncbi:MAG: ribosomal RNA small subunit methyltransferase A [Planctomycetes bacterium]|nr:ribosomal RNA small subunit methyltransferase A [Planctomycetota bacterium]